MKKVRITKEFDFEMAHALWNYDGACKNIHGHSYRLFVTVSGVPTEDESNPKFGMVLDFKELKAVVRSTIINKLDHSLIVYHKTDGESLKHLRNMYEKVYVYYFQPTCENLVCHIAELLNEQLPGQVTLHSLKLYETASSFAEWYASDNQ